MEISDWKRLWIVKLFLDLLSFTAGVKSWFQKFIHNDHIHDHWVHCNNEQKICWGIHEMEPPVRMVPMEHQKYWSLQHWEWVNDREGWRLAAPLTAAARANSSNSNGPKADAIPFPPELKWSRPNWVWNSGTWDWNDRREWMAAAAEQAVDWWVDALSEGVDIQLVDIQLAGIRWG